MNEEIQIRAIVLELIAAGWKVRRDVDPRSVGLPEQMPVIDVFGTRSDPAKDELDGTERLIVEIPNRSRLQKASEKQSSTLGDAQTGTPDVSTYSASADEETALKRLEAISDAIDHSEQIDVAFQVRFLDVSVDQAQSRRIGPRILEHHVRRELGYTIPLLEQSMDWHGPNRTLLLAFNWARWLRIMGHWYPGRRRQELPLADARTIQKDLYDSGVIETPPEDYFETHQSLMALVEGGDANWSRLEAIEHDFRRLVAHVLKELGAPDDVVAAGSSGDGDVFDQIAIAIQLRERPQGDFLLLRQLELLRETDRTPNYRQAYIDFEALLDRRDSDLVELLRELRRRTALIRE